MSYNKLISEVIRGQWFIDHTNVELYYPFIASLLAGKPTKFISKYDKEVSALSIMNSFGEKLKPDEDGTIAIPKNSIAEVSMIGEIMKYGDWCTQGADDIVNELYKAQSYKNVDATIFNVDGPGGSVKAIGPLLEFSKNKTKPVIGYADDALSLHYWALTGVCDYIIAANNVSARFGSVGVYQSYVDNSEAMKKAGYELVELYPKESEHKNLAYRLAKEGKYDMIQNEHLSPLAIKFQNGVKDTRPNLKQAVGVLTGKTFYADEALELGMIDAIGDKNLAIEMAKKLSFKYQMNNILK